MHNLITVLTLITCIAICVRLLLYQPTYHARRRIGVAWCAWILIASTGGQAIHIALLGSATHTSIWSLGVLTVLAMQTYRTGGNVAHLLRVDE